MSPEKAHHVTMKGLGLVSKFGLTRKIVTRFQQGKGSPVTFAGMQFPNKVGLAAGFDKNAQYLGPLSMLGFGHIEIGTVTPLPQPGNPQPRLFRLVKDEALINRMGFNNQGAEVAAARVRAFKKKNQGLIVGGNIGKNKDTLLEDAVQDYLKCFNRLYEVVDYFTVNVSSPNTPNLRQLQEKESLSALLKTLVAEREQWIKKGQPRKPILLKIAPDLTLPQLDDVIQVYFDAAIDGLIATNTTISREHLQTTNAELERVGAGGLSGKPLAGRSTTIISYIDRHAEGKIPLIASGGIMSVDDARKKLDAGASLVQVYTGFIYRGPALVKQLADL